MNNENNNTNTSVKFNYTNSGVPTSVPITSPQQGVTPIVSPTQVGVSTNAQAQPGMVNTGVISQTPINSGVGTTTVSPTVPTGPQIVNDPTADLKTVNASTINTTSSEPRITGTEVVSKVMQMDVKKTNNAGAFENQKLKKVEVEYKPPSKFKMGVMIFFFILILAFIIFLPEVTTFLSELKPGGQSNTTVDDITTGNLVCKLDTSTKNLDKSYIRTFAFTDNKLEKVTMETITKGDIDEDALTLDKLNNSCNSIKEGVLSLDGVEVDCNYRNGKLTETEVFDLNAYNFETVKAAYTEAGADMVKYEFGEDINSIKTSMLQGGFSCEKKA